MVIVPDMIYNFFSVSMVFIYLLDSIDSCDICAQYDDVFKMQFSRIQLGRWRSGGSTNFAEAIFTP